MNVSGVPNEIYRPCYRLNSSTGKIESGSSESEIEELAKRYDPKNMSQAEYDDFIRFLQEKGVLSNIEAS